MPLEKCILKRQKHQVEASVESTSKKIKDAEELKKAGAVIEMGKLAQIKDDFVKSFTDEDVPKVIKEGIADFVEKLESNKNADAAYVERVTSSLKKLI